MSFQNPHARLRLTWGMLVATLALAAPAVAFAQRNPPPTREDVAYGPHERNVLDLWQAKSEAPTPLLIFIHGGGFVQGDKSGVRRNPVIRECLAQGISFASINYRFREHAPIQDILRDAARAVQYLRHHARELHLDPERIASYGSSAGAGTSLWLAFHDDLADPQSEDPVLRESSRLTAAGCLDGQVSYDLRDWAKYVGASPFERTRAERLQFYGFANEEEASTPEGESTMRDCSMIDLISADDPPVAAACAVPNVESTARSDYVHHPQHAISIGERCKKHGVECQLFLLDDETSQHLTNETRERARREQAVAVVKFLLAKLNASQDSAPASRSRD
ncbi:MAG: alpha/beta hydrolase [Pirellulales bacterium]|nr:alpha/beta hydrolase [Pirellulales bacterium]